MNITINTSINAPCCPCEIVPEDPESGEAILVQTDWDFPGFATTFGWSIQDVQRGNTKHRCEHSATDGTVDCKACGVKASDFIAAAGQWLEDNDGATVEDPGYFNS